MLPLPRVPASICAQHPPSSRSTAGVFPPGTCARQHIITGLRVLTGLLVPAHTSAWHKPLVQPVCMSWLRPHCLLLQDSIMPEHPSCH
jgi:hypothetical protein